MILKRRLKGGDIYEAIFITKAEIVDFFILNFLFFV